MERIASEHTDPIATALEARMGFTLAEDYHQKYLLRREASILAEFIALYPSREGFLHSTAVTRANAFCGGHGSELAKNDLPRMGLTSASQALLEAALPS